MKNILSKITTVICTIFLLWCAVSTIEVVSKNTEPNPQYSAINLWIILFAEDEPTETAQYTAYGRYYTDGTVVTNDGNEWSYCTDTISDKTPTDNMPVWIAFDDNGTADKVEDDIILGLVYDRETAIYDDLETALSGKFELERDGNNIHIKEVR